jgi:hypothetical protein
MKQINYSLLVLLFVEIVALGVFAKVPPVQASTCSGHYWTAVQQGTKRYYGSKGINSTQNAQVTGSSNNFFVNSTAIVSDSDNYAEVGWTWHGGDSAPQFFWSIEDGGVYSHGHGAILGINTVHTYKVNNLPGGTVWLFYGDSTQLTTKTLVFNKGRTVAQQERNNACDNAPISHWWNLEKASSGGVFSPWIVLTKRKDDDPDYCLDKLGNTEFYVRRTGSTLCDLSS